MANSFAPTGPARHAVRRVIVLSLVVGVLGATTVVMATNFDRMFSGGKSRLVIEKKPELILIDPAKRTAFTLLT